ncbi:MAG: hypothetical protein WCP29_18955 [Acidobacteriota bacterium]
MLDASSHPASLWTALFPVLEARVSDTALLGAAFSLAAWELSAGTWAVKTSALDGFYRRLSSSAPLQPMLGSHLSSEDFREVFPEAPPPPMRRNQPPLSRIPAGTVAAIETEIDRQSRPWQDPCSCCSGLARPLSAARHLGESLPSEVRQLCRAADLGRFAFAEQLASSRSWVLRCPACGRFFDFVYEYDYGPAGGTIETECIRPLDSRESREWARACVLDQCPPLPEFR